MATGNNVQEVTFFPLSKNVRVHVTFEPELQVPKHIEEEIERLWVRAQMEKQVYNNALFCLSSHDSERIIGKFVEYRSFLATQYNPELRPILDVYPLGVSGLTLSDDTLLVGTRDSTLALYPGYLELVPSGSIEPRAYMHNEIDFIMQLMWELEEEASLGEKHVQEVHPLGLFYSSDVGLYDLGLVVRMQLDDFEKENLEHTREYPFLQWMTLSEWQKVLDNPESKIVPLSRAIWNEYLKTK